MLITTLGFLRDAYWHYEDILLKWLRQIPYLKEYTEERVSSRITLFLIIMGAFACINELYITIEMTFIQKETYEELRRRKLNETLKDHRVVLDDSYHGREFLDEKTGIVIEEFESREKFFSKPVHVAHLYANCRVLDGSDEARSLGQLLNFHIEFSPEEFEDQRRPEFGTSLKVLRRRLYHLFKDTEIFRTLAADKGTDFTVSKSVKIYNTFDEELPTNLDDVQLCFLKIETGDTINCKFFV
ncbi:Erg29p Ecym_6062 [Eremothecium cymbalariae DBVPG|uniref:Uncharacterized protein n=1 Tax=Eremothecium cymbalariae (strain CBS 270.75 / DBVPG 7215 / KCTC 17166 / NRRL Y-17582) TaxID=931890 RepID=G8JUY4_ERECY|nr:hypothetical protein Ecym_6062 [Eremothecium cymbalariae DBVPG\